MSCSLRRSVAWFTVGSFCVLHAALVDGAPVPVPPAEFKHPTRKGHIGHPGEPLWSRAFWIKVLISVFLVLAGGVFSG